MRRIGFVVGAAAAFAAFFPLWGSASVRQDMAQVVALVGADPDAPEVRHRVRTMIEACLAERKSAQAATGCAGLIAEPCLRIVGSGGGEARAECFRREAGGWSSLLADYHARLATRFAGDPAKSAQLKAAQAEWVVDRARRCDRAALRIGAASEPAASACDLGERSRRALYFRILAGSAGLL
jgi:hypothetical protein